MQPVHIPEFVNPFRFSEKHARLQGEVPISDLPRLSASLASTDGAIQVDIQFGKDEQGIVTMKGQLKTEVILTCQRCLQAFTYEIIANFVSGVASTEKAAEAFPDSYDSIVAEENLIAIRSVIEDELILSLPIVPRHLPNQCEVKMPYQAVSSENEERNPFYILKQAGSSKSKKQR